MTDSIIYSKDVFVRLCSLPENGRAILLGHREGFKNRTATVKTFIPYTADSTLLAELRDVQRLKKYKILGWFHCTPKGAPITRYYVAKYFGTFLPIIVTLKIANLLEEAEIPNDIEDVFVLLASEFAKKYENRLNRFIGVVHRKDDVQTFNDAEALKATVEAFVYQPDDYDMRRIIENTKVSLIVSGFGDQDSNYPDFLPPATSSPLSAPVLPGPPLPTKEASTPYPFNLTSSAPPKSSTDTRNDSGSETAEDDFNLPAENVAISPDDDDLITRPTFPPMKKRKLVTAPTVPLTDGTAPDDTNAAEASSEHFSYSKKPKSNISTSHLSSDLHFFDRRLKNVPINVVQGVGSGVHLELNDRRKGERMAPFAASTISAAAGVELLEQAALIADDSIKCQQDIIDKSFAFVPDYYFLRKKSPAYLTQISQMVSYLNIYNHAAREYLVIDAINTYLETQLEEARAGHLSDVQRKAAIKYLESDEMDLPDDIARESSAPAPAADAEPAPSTQEPDLMQE